MNDKKLKALKQYIKKYDFIILNGVIRWNCERQICISCELNDLLCFNAHCFNHEDVKFIKENYPEYLI